MNSVVVVVVAVASSHTICIILSLYFFFFLENRHNQHVYTNNFIYRYPYFDGCQRAWNVYLCRHFRLTCFYVDNENIYSAHTHTLTRLPFFHQLESKCFNRIAAKLINYWKFSLTFFTHIHAVTVSNGSVCFVIIVVVVVAWWVAVFWDVICAVTYRTPFTAYENTDILRPLHHFW